MGATALRLTHKDFLQADKDYEEAAKYKKMKEKTNIGVSIEKMIERKRKHQEEAKSTLLPTI